MHYTIKSHALINRAFTSSYQKKIISFQLQVAFLIAESIIASGSCGSNMGVKIEIETCFYQLVTMYLRFPFLIKLYKYTPVPAQHVVDVANIIIGIAIQVVIICVAALIGAEFFIRSSLESLPAFKAMFVHKECCVLVSNMLIYYEFPILTLAVLL